MGKEKKDLIKKGLSLVLLIVLLSTDSLIIKEPSYLIAFRGAYILIYIILIIYSIFKNKKEGLIVGLFKPVIDHIKEFPRNLQIFIVVGISISIVVITALVVYIYITY